MKQEEAEADAETPELKLDKDSAVSNYANYERQLEELERIVDTTYKTSGKLNVGGRNHDIKVCTEVGILTELAGNLIVYKTIYDQGAEYLGLEKYPAAKVDGFEIDDILFDTKLRATIVTCDDRRKKLTKAMNKMSKYFTKEDQMKRDLAEIGKDLGEDVAIDISRALGAGAIDNNANVDVEGDSDSDKKE